MENYKIIQKDNWKRKDHFNMFKAFEDPFFSVTTELDLSIALTFIKEKEFPVFFSYLYLAIKAANQLPEFRTVYHEGEIREYEFVHGSSTVLKDDETYAFSYLPYYRNFTDFLENSNKEFELCKAQKGLVFCENDINVMHISSLPWASFSAIKHPTNSKDKNTCPKLVFGKFYTKDEQIMMPLAVDVHHGLADGFHVSKFLNLYQNYLDHADLHLI